MGDDRLEDAKDFCDVDSQGLSSNKKHFADFDQASARNLSGITSGIPKKKRASSFEEAL